MLNKASAGILFPLSAGSKLGLIGEGCIKKCIQHNKKNVHTGLVVVLVNSDRLWFCNELFLLFYLENTSFHAGHIIYLVVFICQVGP